MRSGGRGGRLARLFGGAQSWAADLGGQPGLALTCHLPEQAGTGDGPDRCGGRWQGPPGAVPRPPVVRSVHSGNRDLASCWLLPADRGGSRATVCGPLPKRSHSVLLPSVHEEVVAELSQAQAGIQASSAPAGKGPSDPPRWPAHSGSRGPCTCVLASVGSLSGPASLPQPPCPGCFPGWALHSPAVIADCCPPFAPEPGYASRLLPPLSPWYPSHRPASLPMRCPHRPSLLSALSSCRVSVADRVHCDLW